MIKTFFFDEQKLPLVITPAKAARGSSQMLTNLCQDESEFFTEKLLTHGALLFRGFNVATTARLEQFARSFSEAELWNYRGGASPRRAVGDGVYTSTEYPANLMLSLHNELSYSEKYPRLLYFCCAVAPESGGATTLGDSRRILKRLAPEIREEFCRKKVAYIRHLFSRRILSEADSIYSWQTAFETEDKSTIENHCRRTGASFRWEANDKLRLEQVRPATIHHPVTNQEAWFNQACGFHPSELDAATYQALIAAAVSEAEFRLNARFGTGEPIALSALNHIREVLRAETITVNWQTGDVLVVDNILTAHGRMPFAGARKILLAMT